MKISHYISRINTLYQTGAATEHSYRGDLQNLLSDLLPEILVTNEPSRVSCGAPDYVLTRKDVPVGYIEAKDIGVNLHSKQLKEQFDRYKAGLTNLIITDYLHFQFFREGEYITEVRIGEISEGQIKSIEENFRQFENLIKDFVLVVSQSIKSPTRLAKKMAGKARLMADVIEKSLNNDDEHNRRSNLKSQMISFQQMLINDINNKSFADIYAQTIAYGMFAARYHDPSLATFSRMEAAQLIPKSNPFLRKLFHDIAGFDLDDRLVWIVDELVNIFLASDVAKIMSNFGRATKQEDPVVHFYETFLGEYSPSLRKARGVWYTPQPVVNFIVRAVDDILKTEFGLPQGLADSSKTKVTVKVPTHDNRYTAGMRNYEKEVHKVQILDPATGTGTFLSEVVKNIYKRFEGQQGIWSKYVNDNLIPRLNGFELLMASYAMAHLQMDMLLTETGYKPTRDQRFRIFLTNSLEEAHPDTGTLFSSWLSEEANQANAIKRDTPVMVVMGNPPYSGESNNQRKWIMNLMEDYKMEPGGKEKLKERNPKWLNDDYVKFMRFGQYFIEKNSEGILAFINPHGFLDSPTFRGMRWNLLKTYDKIYTIDLHGNSKKKETAPDGTADENVFDIMQGVSINIFVKTGKKSSKTLGKVYHYDLYGKRDFKYSFLNKNSLETIAFHHIPNKAPMYYMVQKDFEKEVEYEKGFAVNDLFAVNSIGIVTARDKLTIKDTRKELVQTIEEFVNLEVEKARHKFNLGRDARDWKVSLAQADLRKDGLDPRNVMPISYRPFDDRWTYFTGRSKGFHCMPRGKVMTNFLPGKNIALIFRRQQPESLDLYIFCSKNIVADGFIRSDNKGGETVAPLYLYTHPSGQQTIDNPVTKFPNLKEEIINEIASGINLVFLPDENLVSNHKTGRDGTFSPLDIFDYIYATLHSPSYRDKYKEFLKIDFPRIPYPNDTDKFWKLVALGSKLRKIHLLESPVVENYITGYPQNGDNVITRKITKTSPGYMPINETHGRVWINEQQYFDNVPLVAWEFYIGGYQPAQKWLKDRKGQELSFEDILHYQKIIVALAETDRLMDEIDQVAIV